MFADQKLIEATAANGESTATGEILGPGRNPVSASGFLPENYVRPKRDIFSHEAILSGQKTMTDTIDQDVELLGNVQAGMRSAGFNSTWLNDDEMRVAHFHRQLHRLMGLS